MPSVWTGAFDLMCISLDPLDCADPLWRCGKGIVTGLASSEMERTEILTGYYGCLLADGSANLQSHIASGLNRVDGWICVCLIGIRPGERNGSLFEGNPGPLTATAMRAYRTALTLAGSTDGMSCKSLDELETLCCDSPYVFSYIEAGTRCMMNALAVAQQKGCVYFVGREDVFFSSLAFASSTGYALCDRYRVRE